jgi:autotransporter family porin
MGAPVAGAETPPLVADGGRLTVLDGNYETRGESSPLLRILRGGDARGGTSVFDTYGTYSHGIHITDADSRLTLDGTTIHTRGAAAHGLLASGTGTASGIKLTGVDIVTDAASAKGVFFDGEAGGRIVGGSISTAGYVAVGIGAEGGSNFSVNGTAIRTMGDAAHALAAEGATSNRATVSAMQATDVSIVTSGSKSTGVNLMLGATAVLTNVDIRTSGTFAHAVDANASHGQVSATGGTWHTSNEDATALRVSDGQLMEVEGTHMMTEGSRALGVENLGSPVGLGNVSITTAGASAFGLYVRGGDYPGIPVTDADRSSITTTGPKAHGAVALSGGRIGMAGSSVATSGDGAHGLFVNAASMSIDGTDVVTRGADAAGARVISGGTLDVRGGSLRSERSSVLSLNDPGDLFFDDGATLRGGNGVLVDLAPESSKAFTLNLAGDTSAAGDIRLLPIDGPPVPDETRLSLAIASGAQWTGATAIVRDLSLDSGGAWNITADSQVDALRNHGGVVAFTPAVPGSVATLTIKGDYDGKDGLFAMRARLGDDDSQADLVHVMGNTSGSSRIAVASLGGEGADTVDGIPLVRVDGQSDGTFELAGRAVAGPYEYFLHKGSVKEPGDGAWYLRSTREPDPVVDPAIDPPVDPEPDEPEVDVPDVIAPPPPETARVLRPEVGTYRANQTAALEMFQGGPGAGEDDEREDVRHSVWARFDRRHTAFDIGDQLLTTSSSSELTLGADLLRGGSDAEGYAGVMAAVGRADTRGRSSLTHYAAKGRVRGAAGGIYAGIRLDDGTYLRGWTQYAHLNQKVEGDALHQERYGSGSLSASVEAGHRWRKALNRDTDVYLEPQAQLTAVRFRGGDHREANGTRVGSVDASGSTARLGLRGSARWHTPSGHTAAPYFAASWLRRLGRLDATRFDGEAFTGGVPRNAYALKLGVTFLRASNWRVWTDVETRFGANGYRRVTGSLGIRRVW